MIEHPNLIPECNVDTVFVEMLGYNKPTHGENIAKVLMILEKKGDKEKAIGFIDNDKRKPPYYLQFQLKEQVSNELNLLKHIHKEQYLVVVDPAMDLFIFKLCRRLNIDISKYKIPGEFEAFKSFTKKRAVRYDRNFKNLLNTIIQKEPPEIEKIKSWISKFSPYN